MDHGTSSSAISLACSGPQYMNLFQTSLAPLIESSDLAIADLGARGGVDEDLRALAWATTVIGFEPEPESAARVARESGGEWRQIDVIPVAVGGHVGRGTLHIPASPEGASLLPHNESLVHDFGHESLHRTVKTLEVETTTLDQLLVSGRLRRVDYLKIDIEGAELDVLRAAQNVLKDCCALKVECSFLEQRLQQPRFFEVVEFLNTHSFQAVDIKDLHRWRRRNLPTHPLTSKFSMPYSRGQLAQADWIFLRKADTCIDGWHAVRVVLIAAALGYFDYAITVMRQNPDASELVRTEYGIELEKDLGDWSKWAGRNALRRASKRTLRGLVPLARSWLGTLSHQTPKIPF